MRIGEARGPPVAHALAWHPRSAGLTLESAAIALRLTAKVLSSTFEVHLDAGLKAATAILKGFGDTVAQVRRAASHGVSTPGVDLAGEERCGACGRPAGGRGVAPRGTVHWPLGMRTCAGCGGATTASTVLRSCTTASSHSSRCRAPSATKPWRFSASCA